MANPPEHPLLRLAAGAKIPRRTGGRIGIPRKFTPTDQAQTSAGLKLTHLADQLDANVPVLELRADPNALAPERLLIFELTGGVMKFQQAVAQIEGLEFLGAEDIDEDEFDKSPVLYLMVPSEGALRNVVTLWREWQQTGALPYGYGQWKNLLSQLRDIRPWGPTDRIGPSDLDVLTVEAASGKATIRLEIELVFRRSGGPVENEAREKIESLDGQVISQARIEGAGYHALLVDVPTAALANALAQDPDGLAGSDAILQIRPQSIFQMMPLEEASNGPPAPVPAVAGDPIAAVFDAVPLAGHPRLAGALSVDDPFDLEPLAVGPRKHGTAMASAVIHGDLNAAWDRPIERPIHFVNMLYATADPEHPERFPDLLPADMFERALARMRDGDSPTAPHVIIINASLGDSNKPFANRISGWARVTDYLSSKYGILFVISAGNHNRWFETQNMTVSQFEGLPADQKVRVTLRASASQIATRRILAPGEAMNAVTVGALNADNFNNPGPLPAGIFDVWAETGLSTVSSGLGPGYGGATKPDILAPGGRHHVRTAPQGDHHRLHPLTTNAAAFGGIAVAAPPSGTSLDPNVVARSVGTSVAAALATGVATRAHEALEAAYPDFVDLPSAQRAVLLKALLVHGARWTAARDLLIEILGPPDNKQHYRQKDNVRRYLGFGAYDPELIVNCATDRATMWAIGVVPSNDGRRFRIPWPAAMSGKAQPHAISATLAWFTPPQPASVAYRAIRLKIVEPTQLGAAGVKGTPTQPDPKQAHKGTVVHRRWEGAKAAAIAGNGYFELDVQREVDDVTESVSFAIVVTIEMPGEAQIYSQVLSRVAVQPMVPVAA